MKHKLLPIIIAGALISGTAAAQQTTRCYTTEYMQQKLANDPSWAASLAQMDEEALHYDASQGDRAVVTIPVVFHVLYSSSSQNISSTRLTEQITVLNQDYSKTNTDISNVPTAFQSLAADMSIQFCLATIDPQGNATTGIERIQTTTTSWSASNDNMKYTSMGGANAWDRNKYLNIWVCNLSGGVLGFAQFPGGNAATDGVVLGYQYVGKTGASYPYNKGRTATHEVGHWLNLRHIWGDANCGNDQVTDTPTQQTANYGCPSFPQVTCNNGPNGDMWMNYMDYTDDACMYMFTTGQKTRAQASLSGSRLQLKNNAWFGCGTLAAPETNFEQYVNVFPNPSAGELNVRIDLIHPDGITVKLFDVLGSCVKQASFSDISSDALSMDLSDLSNGVYIVNITKGASVVTKKIVLNK